MLKWACQVNGLLGVYVGAHAAAYAGFWILQESVGGEILWESDRIGDREASERADIHTYPARTADRANYHGLGPIGLLHPDAFGTVLIKDGAARWAYPAAHPTLDTLIRINHIELFLFPCNGTGLAALGAGSTPPVHLSVILYGMLYLPPTSHIQAKACIGLYPRLSPSCASGHRSPS